MKLITDGIFEKNKKLISVSLIQNSIYEIYPKAFSETSISTLELKFNQIRTLEFLTPLAESLEILNLSNNEIEKIPPETFSEFAKISHLDFSSNKLLVIESRSFDGAESIKNFIVKQNLINAIDQRFFDAAPNLINLDLRENKCVDKKFENVAGNLEEVKENLEKCFEGFQKEKTLTCIFMSGICYLQIYNPGK